MLLEEGEQALGVMPWVCRKLAGNSRSCHKINRELGNMGIF